MGFWTDLGKTWTDFGHKAMDNLGIAYDMASSTLSGDDRGQAIALSRVMEKRNAGGGDAGFVGRELGAGLGEALGATPFAPALSTVDRTLTAVLPFNSWQTITEGLNTATSYGVSRPLSTAVLAGQDWGEFLQPSTWQKAWNASERISPGQAVAGMGAMDVQGGRSINDVIGFIDGQNAKADQDSWFKYTSGALDFSTVLIDPLIVAGKATKLARIKLVTKPIQDAADAERYLDSARYGKIREYAKNASSPANLRQVVFNNSAFGAQQAYVLYGVRHDDEAFSLAMRTMLGDQGAYTKLAERNKQAADQILGKKTDPDLAALMGRTDLTPADEAKIADLTDAHVAAAQERAPLSSEMLYDVRASLVGQGSPRVSRFSQVRAAVHQKSVYDRPVITRLPYLFSNENRHVAHINLNDTNSDRSLRMYMEEGRLPQETVDRYLTAYMGATSPETRFLIASEAENEVVKRIAAQHGFAPEDIKKIQEKAKEGRKKARVLMQKTRAYATDDVVKKWRDDGKLDEFANDPAQALTWLDEEGGVNALPVLETQTADFLPMVDPQLIHQTFRKEASNYQTLYSAGQMTTDIGNEVLSGFYQLWKASALLRLGWPVRALSDETARRVSVWGAAPMVMSTGKGVVKTTQNAFARIRPGITTLSARNTEEQAQMLESISRKTAKEARTQSGKLSGLPIQGMPEATELAGKYQNVEEALADGRVSIKDHVDMVRDLAEKGAVPQVEAVLAGALKEGVLTEAEFERKLLEHSLSKVGKDAYTKPFWQAEVLDTALDHPVVTNPFTGETKGLDLAGKTELESKIVTAGPDGHFDNDHLYDFISEHADTLLLPNHSVGVTRAERGLKLSVLREDIFAPTEAVPGVTLTGHRWTDFKAAMREFSKTSRSAVNEGIRIKGAHGTYDVAAPFGESIYRNLASSKADIESMFMREFQTNQDRLLANKSWTTILTPEDAVSYKAGWERAANLQLGQSAIGRKFLEGWDRGSVVTWLTDSAEGQALVKRMPHAGKNPYEWASFVEHMANEYVPDLTYVVTRNGEDLTKSLRKEVLEGRATVDDLKAATGGQALPTIHGERLDFALGVGQTRKAINKVAGTAYNVLGTLPADKASRFPVFAQRYQAHMQNLVRAEESFKGEMISTLDVIRLEHTAREKALHDVRSWLYDTESTTDLARKMRYLSPFASAWQDSISHWTKIMAVENPATVGYLWNVWQAPENAGLIVDQNGHELGIENGKDVWYAVDPKTGERARVDPAAVKDLGTDRYVTFKLPAGIPPGIFGKDVRIPVKINKKSFNTFLQLDPGAGPVVQFPVNEILRRNPTLTKSDSEVYNYALKAILPFGVQGSSAMTLLPSSAREAVIAWRGTEDDVFNGRAMSIFQTDMVNWTKGGKHGPAPSLDEAAKKAGQMGFMRLMGAMILPVNPQYASPYQPYIDAYRQMKAADPANADMNFYERFGDEYFSLANRVTKTVAGVPPTVEGWASYGKYKDLIDANPELASLIVGQEGAGEFNKAIYEAQKATHLSAGDERTMREVMSPRQQIEDNEKRLGWLKYGKLMDSVQADLSDRGLKNLNDVGAEDLKASRDAYLEQMGKPAADGGNPAWHQEFFTFDKSKNDRRIEAMTHLASDRRLLQRDDIRGLADYLILRQQVLAELDARSAAGMAKTLTAEANTDLAQQWNDSVFTLIDSNLSFGQLYNRWLSHDTLGG